MLIPYSTLTVIHVYQVTELCSTLNNMHMYIRVTGQSTNVYMLFCLHGMGLLTLARNKMCQWENSLCDSRQDQLSIAPDQCKYQPVTSARVSGTPEGHGYVCGTVASAPLLRGTVETDNVIHKYARR